MAELAGTALPRTSRVLGRSVRRVPDGYGTSAGGDHVFLEAKYADLIEPLRFNPRFPGRQAKAIYFMLHEYAHTLQVGKQYEYPKDELDANTYAADKFRWFCLRKMNFTPEQTRKLWQSLPDYYQRPKAI